MQKLSGQELSTLGGSTGALEVWAIQVSYLASGRVQKYSL